MGLMLVCGLVSIRPKAGPRIREALTNCTHRPMGSSAVVRPWTRCVAEEGALNLQGACAAVLAAESSRAVGSVEVFFPRR